MGQTVLNSEITKQNFVFTEKKLVKGTANATNQSSG